MTTPTVATTLRLANGVPSEEFDHVVLVLDRLDDRLRSYKEGSVELQLSVKDRDKLGQHTTLEAIIAGEPRFVATSDDQVFEGALAEVRDQLIRQITDHRDRVNG